jgi:hypothetical protein
LFFVPKDKIDLAASLDNACNLAAALAGVDGRLEYDFMTQHFPSIKSKKLLEPATAAAVRSATLPKHTANFTTSVLRNFTPAVGLSYLVYILISMWNMQMQLSEIRRNIEINTASNQIVAV